MKRATVAMLVSLMLASPAWAQVALDQASIQAAINAATPGDTIQLAPGTGTLAGNVNVNKAVIIQGDSGGTILQVSGTGSRISLMASGAALSGVEIVKTDKTGVQNIIYIGASNVTVEKCTLHGQYVMGDPDVSRAMEMTGGLSNLLIDQNTIHGLRQPAYINASSGTISNTHVYGTRGWVLANANMNFTANTWGTGAQSNYLDIAILPGTDPGYYADLPAISAANDGAVIEDQRTSPYTASVVFVDAAAPAGGDGTITRPYQTIAQGLVRVVAGGTVKAAAGTYAAVTVNKSVTLLGANAGIHAAVGTHPTETVGVRGSESVVSGLTPAADNITVDGFKFLKAGTRLIDTYANANYFHLTNCIVESTTYGATTGVVQFGGGSHTDMVMDFNLFQDKGASTFYAGGGPFDRLRIAHNRFNVAGDAVFWSASPLVDGVVEGNEFDGTIGGVPGAGFAEMNIGQGGNIAIRDNWFHDQQYTAFQVGIIGGSVTGNTFERIHPYSGGLPGNAFELWGGQWGTAVSTNVDVSCNTIRYNDIPGAAYPTYGIRLRAPETGLGIDASTIHVANNTFADGGARADAKAVRHQGDPSTTLDADGNWWGTTNGSVIAAMAGTNVNYTPWLNVAPTCTMPGNVLYLLATEPSLYVKPGELVILHMNVANLQQMVNGCQALIGYSSTYFPAPGTVAAGGGVWTELIYQAWRAGPGEVDTAIGVNLEGAAGTQGDGTVAVLTLTAGTTDGTTRLVFRPDGENGYATMLSDLSAQPVWPAKIDSMDIIIDGTSPTITCPADVTVSTDAGVCQASNVDLGVPVVADNLSGVASVVNDAPAVFPKGDTTVTWTATDKAGNVSTCTQKVTVNDDEDPVITCPADVTVNADSGKCYATGVALGMPITGDNCAVASVTNDAPAQLPKGVTNVTWTVTDSSDNTSTCVQTVTVNDLEPPAITCPANIIVNADPGVCEATLQYTEPFDVAPTLCATKTPNCWYVDRYAPAGFSPVVFSGRNCLKHSISTADSFNNRPAGYRTAFYNTQGRKYDVNMTVPGAISVELYIPADWANRARRADIWATVVDSSGTVSGYPIAGFINSDTVDPLKPDPTEPRFRVWMDEGSGGWVDLGLPDGFAYDQWYTIEVEITATEYVYTITGASGSLTETTPKTEDVVRISNVMLQAYNFSDATHPGESYDVYWDNVTVGPKGPVVTDNCLVAGVVGVRSDSLELTDPYPLGMTTITWTATDSSGNTATCGQTVTVLDAEPPTVSIDSAQQDTVELLGSGAPNALQGAVVITVSASDNCSLAGAPAVKVTDAASVETVLTASGTGPWTYTYTITAGTANGVATITATATDASSNTSTDTDTFNINKNQITGQVQLEGFVGASRDVTFVVTGATTKTWVLNVTGFTGHVASYTLTDVPDGATHLSAKADLSLRRKLALLGGSNNQWAANFVGTEPVPPSTPGTGDYLRGGDLKADNFVNVLDYSVMKTNWFTASPAADINGDGSVNSLDYGILKANWFVGGDPQ